LYNSDFLSKALWQFNCASTRFPPRNRRCDYHLDFGHYHTLYWLTSACPRLSGNLPPNWHSRSSLFCLGCSRNWLLLWCFFCRLVRCSQIFGQLPLSGLCLPFSLSFCLLYLFLLLPKGIRSSLDFPVIFGLFFSCFKSLLLLLILPSLDHLRRRVAVDNILI
jgi:hypothetical protein